MQVSTITFSVYICPVFFFSFPLILKTSSNCTLNPYTCTPFVVGAHIYDHCTSWPSKTFSRVWITNPPGARSKKGDCRAFCVRTSRLRQSFIFRRFINLHFSSLNSLILVTSVDVLSGRISDT